MVSIGRKTMKVELFSCRSLSELNFKDLDGGLAVASVHKDFVVINAFAFVA